MKGGRNLVRYFTPPAKSFAIRNGNRNLFSTATAVTDRSSSLEKGSLLQRLMAATNPRDPNPKQPISQILSDWVDDGRFVHVNDVRNSIKQFRKMGRYSHALEISEWAVNTKIPDLSCGDAAVRLDLIYKVQGVEAAEGYFESFPEEKKIFHIYGALLNGYVKKKLTDKAEVIMKKMRQLGYATILSYNGMIHLYSQTGELIKLKALIQEMEAKDIHFDKFSYGILLNTYASASDTVEMETLLRKMEADPQVVMDWTPYSIAAKGYQKAGDIVNAEIMLKKAEGTIKDRKLRNLKAREMACNAFQFLMTQYASMGRKDEVYHIWNLHSIPQKLINKSYTSIISSLLKVDDIDGARKMLDEWFLKKVSFSFDIRIPNLVIAAYCKKGQMQKAESLVSLLREKGEDPNPSTWSYMASGYCNSNQMEEAVKMMKKAISKRPRWNVLVSWLKYLREKGNVNEAEEIIGLFDEGGKFSSGFRDRISRYIRKGDISEPENMKQEFEAVEDDTFDASELKFETPS